MNPNVRQAIARMRAAPQCCGWVIDCHHGEPRSVARDARGRRDLAMGNAYGSYMWLREDASWFTGWTVNVHPVFFAFKPTILDRWRLRRALRRWKAVAA